MTVIFTETWTGTNGDPWDTGDWDEYVSSGGGTEIQSNRGRMTASGATYANAEARVIGIATRQDSEMLVEVHLNSVSESYVRVMARVDNSVGDAYWLQIQPAWNDYYIIKRDGWSESNLGTTSITYSASGIYMARFRVEGTALKAKVWVKGDAEPGWGVEVTDSFVSAAGRNSLGLVIGNYTSAYYVEFDNLTIDDLTGVAVPVFSHHYRQRRSA